MDAVALYLASDRVLRSVVDRLSPDDLARPVPPSWSRSVAQPTVRDVLAAHAYDEAWVPDLLEGRRVQEGDRWHGADLLGGDPVAGYDAVQDRAEAAVAAGVPAGTVLRFQYGDYAAEEGFAHLALYRALQAWDLADLLGHDLHLPAEVVDGLEQHVLPHADEWRRWEVLPPALEPLPGAEDEVRVLRLLGRDAR